MYIKISDKYNAHHENVYTTRNTIVVTTYISAQYYTFMIMREREKRKCNWNGKEERVTITMRRKQ